MIREAKGDSEKEDAIAIQQIAQATLIGQEKFNKEFTLRRLKGYMNLIGVRIERLRVDKVSLLFKMWRRGECF